MINEEIQKIIYPSEFHFIYSLTLCKIIIFLVCHFLISSLLKNGRKAYTLGVTISLALEFLFVVYLQKTSFEIPSQTQISALFLLLSFHLFYFEIFSILCRGFSLQIILDLEKTPHQSLKQLIQNYNNTSKTVRGVEGLLNKRLQTLKGLRLIRFQEMGYQITFFGKLTFIFTKLFRKVFSIQLYG